MQGTTERTLDLYLANADELAQRVFNFWGPVASAGRQDALTPEFMDLFAKADRYRRAKSQADNHREFGVLRAETQAEEQETRLDFARTYKNLDDSVMPKPSEWDKAVLNTRGAMKA